MTKVRNRHHLEKRMENVTEQSKRHTLFWIMMAGFMGLILIRNIFKIEYPIVILLAYACFMAMLADHDETMALAISFKR